MGKYYSRARIEIASLHAIVRSIVTRNGPIVEQGTSTYGCQGLTNGLTTGIGYWALGAFADDGAFTKGDDIWRIFLTPLHHVVVEHVPNELQAVRGDGTWVGMASTDSALVVNNCLRDVHDHCNSGHNLCSEGDVDHL